MSEPDVPPERTGPDRRRVLLVGGVGAAGALAAGAGIGVFASADGTERPAERYGPARAGTVAARSRFAQIVAHEDDDLLFMTPDLWNTMRAGSPHMTVYLTAGESVAGRPPDTHDLYGYVADREKGLRTAYALMLGAPDQWLPKTLQVGRVSLQSYTLAGHPYVKLVFVRMPDGKDPRASLHLHTLSKLWEGSHDPRACGLTQAADGSPFRQCVGREELLSTLVALLESFRPTVIRAQDPAQDRRYAGDHFDHVAAAHFAGEAVRRYATRHSGQMIQQVGYRDYNIRNIAVNLSAADRALKQRIFAAYARHDYRISFENPHWDAYEARIAYRWPRGVTFTGPDAVYAVAAGRLVAWRRSSGHWSGPEVIGDPGGPLTHGVSVAGDRVFGLRADTGEIVMYAGGHWRGLGRPEPRAVKNMSGTPLAVAGPGGPALFVRNGRGGISTRRLAHGDWTPWTSLPGINLKQVARRFKKTPGRDGWTERYGDIQDGMAAVVTEQGLIELYAATRSRLIWWRQPKPGAALVVAGILPVDGPIAPLAATRTAGRTSVRYREPWSGRAREIVRTGERWGPAGFVRVMPALDGEPPIVGAPHFKGALVGVPAALPDGSALCAVGADGALYLALRAGNGYAPWQPAP